MDCRPTRLLCPWDFRARYWSGLLFPSPRDLPDPGIEPVCLASPALAGGFFFFFFLTTEPPEKPFIVGAGGNNEKLKSNLAQGLIRKMPNYPL